MAPFDQELIERVRERDASAFDLLFTRYREPIHRHLVRTVRDEEAAGDLVQDVFLRVWNHADQWDGRGAVKAWLFRIATNLALNHLRSARRRPQRSLELPADPTGEEEDCPIPGWMIDAATHAPDALLEQAEQQALLRRLVDELPAEKREVFRMIHEAEMEIRAVAAALGIPEGTVKSRLHYATRRLAREWSDIVTAWEEL